MIRLPDPQRSYAVLVGVWSYDADEILDLPAVENNLSALRRVLTDPDRTGLPAEHCITVRNPRDARGVFRKLRQYAARAEDTLLFYFAGHGFTGDRNELYLSLSETHPDELPVSAIAYDVVRQLVRESPARNRVVVLDTCFSGLAVQDMAGNPAATVLGQVGIEGTYILTSTERNAPALAPPGARYTAFTGELLRLLVNGVPEAPRLLTFAEIFRHLLTAMLARGLPVPGQRGTGTIDQLALTQNAWQDRAAGPAIGSRPAHPYKTGAGGLRIRRAVFDGIVAHCLAVHPITACGLVAGPIGSNRPERFIPMWNAAASMTFYEFDPHQQLAVWREMDANDEEPVAIYYSHTATEAFPSRTTVAFAGEKNAHYIIVSTRDPDAVQFRSFLIRDGEVTEEPVEVI
ncbi:Mov34/MPN/PAD-1 family protein [Actinoplanes sp. SE50]|nr:Mov34/MPN/PAD-1 family protein [Actinoplanes sp. SE50/110]ATO83986.1 Mov34/MPN/PAD-1 family protein [Actinoplanes sp. SE50]SLM01396.1 CysO-cysteine peptidase [Actinoplanes sp. SE50/110]